MSSGINKLAIANISDNSNAATVTVSVLDLIKYSVCNSSKANTAINCSREGVLYTVYSVCRCVDLTLCTW